MGQRLNIFILCILFSSFTPSAYAKTFKIWPLGNSITEGTGSTDLNAYRKSLRSKLQNHSVQFSDNVDFVGTFSNGSFSDNQHNGSAGKKSSEIRQNITGWLQTLQNRGDLPDFVLLHIGTNDISANRQPNAIIADINAILDEVWRYNMNARVFLCGIIPRLDGRNSQTEVLNNAIRNDVVEPRRNNEGKSINYVDQYFLFKNFNNWENELMSDHLHPNDAGYEKMANRFFDVVKDYIPDVITPVELFTFNGYSQDFQVDLNWRTLSETNNLGFYIEHNFADRGYEEIGFVEGNGTTTLEQAYNYSFAANESGTHQFRLRQVDTDGSFSYSDEIAVSVEPPAAFVLHQNYPNPFRPAFSARADTRIQFDLNRDADVKVTIFDVLGRQVATLTKDQLPAGRHEVSWDGTTGTGILAASGTYLISMQAGDHIATKPMQLVR